MKNHNIITKLYACGDIHGQAKDLIPILDSNDIKNCTLILLGDVGIFRYRDYKAYIRLDEFCSDKNIQLYALRGNHDNPGFYSDTKDPIVERFWNKFSNFNPLDDFDILHYQNKNILILPGAISTDRFYRKNYNREYINLKNYYRGGDWWPNEKIKEYSEGEFKIHAIMSHNGPRNALNMVSLPDTLKDIDPTLERDLKAEQAYLHNLLIKLNPEQWWFGHYHVSETYKIKNTFCRILNINEIKEFKYV